MYRVVLDPIVILRGLINPYSICGTLLSDYAARYKAIFSAETGQALVFLPFHPMLIARFPRLAHLDPRQAGRLLARAEKVQIDHAVHPNVVVATAIAAQADYLICEDAQLLAAREKIPVPILSAAAFVALLASEPGQ
jgi:predicted nucleic acid-binding protein